MQVSVNKADLAAVQAMLVGVKDGYPRVMRNALNRTVTTTIVNASQKIREDLNITDANVKVDFAKKTLKATLANLKAQVVASGKPVPLIKFIGTSLLQNNYVSVRVKKDRYKLRHAFMAKMKSGHVGVFGRKEALKHYTHKVLPWAWPWGRYYKKMGFNNQIIELAGPRIEDEYSKLHIITPVYTTSADTLVHYINQQLQVELNKLR